MFPVRSIVFDEAQLCTVYPNLSTGLFYLVIRAHANEIINARVFDTKGSVVREFQERASGFLQKIVIDLSMNYHAAGIYLLQVRAGEAMKNFKVYKQ